MPIVFACPECRAGIRVREAYAGREAACPKCGRTVRVPDGEAPPPVGRLLDGAIDAFRCALWLGLAAWVFWVGVASRAMGVPVPPFDAVFQVIAPAFFCLAADRAIMATRGK